MKSCKRYGRSQFLFLVVLLATGLQISSAEEYRSLDEETQQLKTVALELNQELNALKEEMLYPASSQVAVFLSMDVGEFFSLNSVELTLDGKNISNHLYTEGEIDALYRGGVQKLYLGNLTGGDHELVAVFTGTGNRGREYRRGAQVDFVKGKETKYLEFVISDREQKLQPEFFVREWE
ncbi:MAG: AraC family transcriptional regulator [Gammaproteobacteria bacterium]